MKVTKKTVEEWIYTTSKGDEIPLRDMNDKHLVNAFGVACVAFEDAREGTQESRDAKQALNVLRDEITRRMQCSSSSRS